jgi:hypothetical protein
MCHIDICAKLGNPTTKSGLTLQVLFSPIIESSDQRFAFCS